MQLKITGHSLLPTQAMCFVTFYVRYTEWSLMILLSSVLQISVLRWTHIAVRPSHTTAQTSYKVRHLQPPARTNPVHEQEPGLWFSGRSRSGLVPVCLFGWWHDAERQLPSVFIVESVIGAAECRMAVG